jgi:hypothetical protein
MLDRRTMAMRLRTFVFAVPNSSAEVMTTESGNGKARQPGIKTFRESDEKILRCGFNENVDVTSATEALPRIEIHDCRLASLQHFQRA